MSFLFGKRGSPLLLLSQSELPDISGPSKTKEEVVEERL